VDKVSSITTGLNFAIICVTVETDSSVVMDGFECLKILLNLYKLVGSKLGNGQRIANSLNSSPVAVYEFIVCAKTA